MSLQTALLVKYEIKGPNGWTAPTLWFMADDEAEATEWIRSQDDAIKKVNDNYPFGKKYADVRIIAAGELGTMTLNDVAGLPLIVLAEIMGYLVSTL